MKKKLAIIMSIILLPLLFSGCTSLSGAKVTRAVINSTDWKSVETSEEFSMSIDGKELKSSEYMEEYYDLMLDIINHTTVKSQLKADLTNMQSSAKYTVSCNDVNVNGSSYYDKEKVWYKSPLRSKYIEVDLAQLFPKAKDKFGVGVQERAKGLTLKFIEDYMNEYKHVLKKIQDKGTITITTPEGSKSVNDVEVVLNNEELSRLISYTLKNAANSDVLEEYVLDIFKTYIESIDETKIAGFVPEDVEDEFIQVWREMRKDLRNNADEYAQNVVKNLTLGNDGIVLDFYVDNSGNLCGINVKVNIIAGNDEYGNAKIALNDKILFYNINNTVVEMPKFDSSNSITFKEYVKSSSSLRDSELGEMLGVKPKRVTLYVKDYYDDYYSSYYYNRESFKDRYGYERPYIDGETLMAPGKYLGEQLGYNVSWDEETESVTYKDPNGKTELKVTVGSKIAYLNGKRLALPKAPAINDGSLMVPLRTVSEKLGGEVYWYSSPYSSYQYVRITRYPN